MNREETKKAIEVMQAYVDGAEIQVRSRDGGDWSDYSSVCTPSWQWVTFDYRIKPKEPRTFYAVEHFASTLAVGIGPLHSCKENATLAAPGKPVIELVEVIR